MFASSIVTYLFVRLASIHKISTPLKNISMFLVPVLIYIFLGITQQTSFIITPYQLLVIAVMSFFFSYLGNTFSLKSIELAPNPGFSLVISKSYVVFTTLAAVVLFGAELTLSSLFSIGLIVLGSALIMIDPNSKNTKNKTIKTKTIDKNLKNKKVSSNTSTNKSLWIWFSIGAFFCWGMLALTSKYLLDIGVTILSILVYSRVIVSSIIGWEIYTKKISFKLPKKQWLILLIIGLAGASFNYFMQLSFQTAPNIGFVNALNASSIGIVALLSGIIFKDELTLQKLIGVGITITGVILLVK